MTRVSRASSHRGVDAAAPLARSRAASRKKKPYKIVLEAVTEEKRKLKSTLTYRDQAPPGFGYVPVGHPDITEWCKEQCRQRTLAVYIVSAKPRSKAFFDPEKISAHVHRIGHHFPLEIIELACKKFGYRYSEDGGLRRIRARDAYGPAYFERGIADYEQRQRLQGRAVAAAEDKDHIRGAIREIFPKIPEADLNSIANHAFQEGTNRVGNAKELSLARRVQLAVVAHIRHTYTKYDSILKHKTGTWTEARQQVEHVSLAKLKEWRDESDEASHELEETFREVIILDDEDEDDSSDTDSPSAPNTREHSMEIVSDRATARDLQPEAIDRMRAYDPYLSGASRRTIVLRPVPYSPRQPVMHSPLRAPITTQAAPDTRMQRPGPIAYEPQRIQADPLRARPTHMRDADGRLYSLQPIEPIRDNPMRPPHNYHVSNAFGEARQVRSLQASPAPQSHQATGPLLARQTANTNPFPDMSSHPRRPRLTPSSRRASDQDVVLPSVEQPELLSQKRKSIPSTLYKDDSSLTYDAYRDPTAKRMRPAYNAMPEVVDLTSSPSRPVYSTGREAYPAGQRPQARGFEYVPVSPRGAPPGDARGPYREVVVLSSPRDNRPEHDGSYDQRGAFALDGMSVNEPARRYAPPAPLYIQNGYQQGHYPTH